ncbi:MAG: ABC transporter permease [Rhodothalassiaceae bacterium]
MTLFTLVRANLFRKPLRFLLTSFAIFIAFFLFTVLLAFDRGLNSGTDLSAANRLVVSNKINFTQPLPVAYANRVATMNHVEVVTHQSWFGAYYQEPTPFFAGFAVEPETFLQVYDELIMPQAQKEAFLANQRGALIGRDLADLFGFSVGDLVPISSNIFDREDGGNVWDMEIAAIYDLDRPGGQANQLFFHYDYLNEARSFGRDVVGNLVIKTEGPDFNEQVARTIDAQFENSPYATETTTEEAFNASFVEQLGDIGFVVSSVAGAAVFIILIIVGNTMVLAVRERTKEIGVMKALGFRAQTMVALVIGESLLLCLLGGALGVGLGTLMAMGIQQTGAPFPLIVDAEVLMNALILAAVLALVTALIPAVNAYRQPIAAAFARG